MAHGNKKYFFEELKAKGDTLLIKPNKNQSIVNVYSVTSQIKVYQKEAGEFKFDIDLNKNGSATIYRLS